MSRPLTAFVLANQYVILDAPEPLRDDDGVRCQASIDHDEKVIWIDRAVPAPEKQQLLLDAVSRAWQERMHFVPSVE